MSPTHPAPETVLVPLCRLGLGTGRGAILDARTGRTRSVPAAAVRLTTEGVACLELRVADRDGDLACVETPGGWYCWVRPAVPAAERGTAA